jgi:hypothetical protein
MGTIIPFPVKQPWSDRATVEGLANICKVMLAVKPIPPAQRCTAMEMLRRAFPGEDPVKLAQCARKLERIRSIIDEAAVRT